MSWLNDREATNDDLKAIFAYLRSIASVKNWVPDPRPPVPIAATASAETR